MKGSLYNFRKIKLTNEEERSEDKTEVHQKRPPQTLQFQPPPVPDKVEDVAQPDVERDQEIEGGDGL